NHRIDVPPRRICLRFVQDQRRSLGVQAQVFVSAAGSQEFTRPVHDRGRQHQVWIIGSRGPGRHRRVEHGGDSRRSTEGKGSTVGQKIGQNVFVIVNGGSIDRHVGPRVGSGVVDLGGVCKHAGRYLTA